MQIAAIFSLIPAYLNPFIILSKLNLEAKIKANKHTKIVFTL